MKTIIAMLLLCSTCLVAISAPQAEAVVPSEKPPERVCVDFPNEEIRTALSNVSACFNLDIEMPDEYVRTIFRNVADLFELNLCLHAAVVERTSINRKQVTWRQVFTEVLTPLGYTFEEDGNIVNVIRRP